MSNRLAVSAALSVLMMAGMVVFDTRPADEPFGATRSSPGFEASTLTPQVAAPLLGSSR